MAKDCPDRVRPVNDICYVCGGRGHIAAVCPSKGKIPQSSFGKATHRPANRSMIHYPQGAYYHPTNDRKCFICGRTGHMAKDCRHRENSYGESGINQSTGIDVPLDSFIDRKICNNCHREGHIARDCPEPQKCRRCGQPGHIAADCQNEVQCLRCLQSGHLAKDCPNAEVCHICHQSGHSRSTCPCRE